MGTTDVRVIAIKRSPGIKPETRGATAPTDYKFGLPRHRRAPLPELLFETSSRKTAGWERCALLVFGHFCCRLKQLARPVGWAECGACRTKPNTHAKNLCCGQELLGFAKLLSPTYGTALNEPLAPRSRLLCDRIMSPCDPTFHDRSRKLLGRASIAKRCSATDA
jgi:hypothetical protein